MVTLTMGHSVVDHPMMMKKMMIVNKTLKGLKPKRFGIRFSYNINDKSSLATIDHFRLETQSS